MLQRSFDGGAVLRSLVLACCAALSPWISAPPCQAAGRIDGSLTLASDYLVRGVSRTNDRAAAQGDLHYLDDSGFVVGVFASNTQFDPEDRKDVELDGYLGYRWTVGSDFSGKVVASHYVYPWDSAGSGYDYDELDLTFGFQDWLAVNFVYSPNAWIDTPADVLIGVPNLAVEVNLQHSVAGKLSATAGVGYSHLAGPTPGGYEYWSIGAAYDLNPFSFVASYVNCTTGAKAFFYNGVAGGRWTGMMIWRF